LQFKKAERCGELVFWRSPLVEPMCQVFILLMNNPIDLVPDGPQCHGPKSGFKARLNGRLGSGPLQQRWSISDYVEAYTAGTLTPSQVAENVLKFEKQSEQQEPPMRFFISVNAADIRRQAAESTERCARPHVSL
jgi:hypothetical protein